MKLFRFDTEVGMSVDKFGSSNLLLSRILRTIGQVQVGCMHLAPDGLIGYHQATVPQLFLVVQGEGWVRGAKPERFNISVGQAACWDQGDWHEVGTDIGMVAIVIECDAFESIFMPEV